MELLLLIVGTGVIAVVGVGIGMLVAPRLDRWAAPKPPPESAAMEPGTPMPADHRGDERPDDNT